jgi:hypothetical protein
MSRRIVLFAMLALTVSVSVWAASPGVTTTPAAGAAGAGPAKLKSVTLHVFNRVFEQFHDKVEVVPNREFRVGDTDFTFRVVRFEPDFTLDVKKHKVSSRSGEPKNPAFQIVVSRAGTPHDTSWAFFNMPPHFGIREELAFVATKITFTNRPPLVSSDSIALRIQQWEGSKK